MTQITGQNLIVCLVKNQLVPQEGPKSVPLELDFTNTDSFVLDLLTLQQLGYSSQVQCAWIDTSAAGSALTIYLPDSRQTVVVPAQRQGWFPLLCPNPAKLQFSSAQGANNIHRIQLLNFPMAAFSYPTT